MKLAYLAATCLFVALACDDDGADGSSRDDAGGDDTVANDDSAADDDTAIDDDTAPDDDSVANDDIVTDDDGTTDDDVTADDDVGTDDDTTVDDDVVTDDGGVADDDVTGDDDSDASADDDVPGGDDDAGGPGSMMEAGAGGITDWDAFLAARPDYTDGQDVFRHDTFGSERFWTETLQMHDVIATAVDPTTALTVGLKVDADALPDGILDQVDLTDPATTVALLQLDAVVGVKGHVDESGALIAVGITCALCHSTVDDSVAPGIGSRIDGSANRDLNPGLILSLSPAFGTDAKAALESWGAGYYDPRFNQDGISDPVLIPPIYGLANVSLETYTGDGDVGYWNAYVAVTQMGGIGSFEDERIGISISADPDLVTPQLPALVEYELSLEPPAAPSGSFDEEAAARGQALFEGDAMCSTCHSGIALTDVGATLHDPEETGMDPAYAERSATGQYRTTPLRALFDHPPYFHDGSAATLEAVVEHYDVALELELDDDQKADLVQYLLSL